MSRLWILAGLAMVALMAWQMMTPRNSWHYKMTIEVDTPEGVRSGFVVRQVRHDPGGSWFPFAESRPQWRVKGEAVVIDLPNGRSLFALMRSASVHDVDYGARIADRAMGVKGGRIVGLPGPVELYPTSPRTSGLARTNPLPMLVTLADPRDPKSIEPVDPHNLADKFGPGYALKRITINIVNEPVTTSIERKLPTFGSGSGYSDWYRSLEWSDPRRVGPEDFKKGSDV